MNRRAFLKFNWEKIFKPLLVLVIFYGVGDLLITLENNVTVTSESVVFISWVLIVITLLVAVLFIISLIVNWIQTIIPEKYLPFFTFLFHLIVGLVIVGTIVLLYMQWQEGNYIQVVVILIYSGLNLFARKQNNVSDL